MAKCLFLCKRARPDIQTAVSFLCTRVKCPDEDDWKKLKRMFQYLRGTRELVLTLEGEDLRVIKWWVDASYAVHHDMRSHTGGVMSLGKGAAYSTSTRQKLNTKSSTEAELVGVDDCMGQILWTRYFIEAQGYDVQDNVVYRDNQSSILLEKNGRGSSSKRTKHVRVRYFFITDRISLGDLKVEYCPTGLMVADFFTKPLQGTQFRLMRDWIMNIGSGPAASMPQDHRSVLGNNGGCAKPTSGLGTTQPAIISPSPAISQKAGGPRMGTGKPAPAQVRKSYAEVAAKQAATGSKTQTAGKPVVTAGKTSSVSRNDSTVIGDCTKCPAGTHSPQVQYGEFSGAQSDYKAQYKIYWEPGTWDWQMPGAWEWSEEGIS